MLNYPNATVLAVLAVEALASISPPFRPPPLNTRGAGLRNCSRPELLSATLARRVVVLV